MPGLGFAKAPVELLAEDLSTSPDQLNSAVTPTAPEIDVLGATEPPPAAKEPPLIDFGDNPLGAIGAVLTNVSRGARGQPLFTEELKNRRMQQEDRELRRATVGVDAMSKGLELLKNTPASARGDVVQQYGALFEKIIPGFTATLEQAAQSPDATETQLQALGEHAPILISMAGSLEGALELAQKPALMNQLNETADLRNQPEITQAFQRVDKILKASPEGQQFLAQAAADGFTLSDLQDPKIQEAFGLEQSHVNSIARNPEIQSSLREFGFIPTADSESIARESAKEQAKLETRSKLSGVPISELVKSGGNTNVTINQGEDKFADEIGKEDAKLRAEIIRTGDYAIGTEQDLAQMAQLLSSGDVQTGATSPLVTGLQSFAQDLGVDVEEAGKRAGVDVGDLASKQEFDRLATRVVIDGFEKFKGNLNQKEVDLALGAFAGLGRDEEANQRAIASLIASSRVARQRAADAINATSAGEFRALQRERLAGGTEMFDKALEVALQEVRGDQTIPDPLPEGLPQGSTDAGLTSDGKRMFKLPDGRTVVEE